MRKILPPEVVLEAYRRNCGNKTATASELSVDRQTLRKLLALYGADKRPVAGGSTKPLKHNVLPLPRKGEVRRYILTSAQNNTKVFTPFLKNLEAYAEWLQRNGDLAQIMVARYTYNKNQYLRFQKEKPGVPGDLEDDCWFDPAIEGYVCDDPERHGTCRWQLAPDLWFCAEMQIEPTATSPLSDLQTYTGTDSSIFPHTKVALESVPTMPGQPVKMNYTTGTVTGRNYIKKKAGLKAEFHHTFAALLVEVDSSGNWWARQLVADSTGSFYDLPAGDPVKVSAGKVSTGHRVEAVNWGDTHATDLPLDRAKAYWWKGGVIDLVRPKHQFFNDLMSFQYRGHHGRGFSEMMRKHLAGDELVEAEMISTAGILELADRDFCQSVVVRSNHDTHGERWLDEADYKSDLPNVEYFLEAQLARVRAMKAGNTGWMFSEWALKKAGCPENVRFLRIDESFVICAKNHPIECGLHGHLGPNGSRGTTANLSRMGARINKGHDHAATIRNGVYSAGVCALEQGYNQGPTSWSVSHICTYLNGKRCILTERVGRLWA